MNEKVKNYFRIGYYIISGVLILLLGIFWIIETGKNKSYQDIAEQLEGTTEELRDENTEFKQRLAETEGELERIESYNTELESRYSEAMASVRRLENDTSQLREENQGFGEDIEELEKLFFEFFPD